MQIATREDSAQRCRIRQDSAGFWVEFSEGPDAPWHRLIGRRWLPEGCGAPVGGSHMMLIDAQLFVGHLLWTGRITLACAQGLLRLPCGHAVSNDGAADVPLPGPCEWPE